MDLIRLFRDTAETLPDIEPDDVKLSGPVFKRNNLDEKDLASADADNILDELKPEYLQFPTTIGEDRNNKKPRIEEEFETDWVSVEIED